MSKSGKPGFSRLAAFRSSLVLLTFTLVSCVTQSHAVKLVESDGRIGVEETHITDRQADVMTRITERFQSAPECSQIKTSLSNSRKAYVMEVCEVALTDGEMAYGGVPVTAMNFRFIDARLLQMEMLFGEDPAAGEAVSDAVSSELALSARAAGNHYQTWQAGKDLVELQSDESISLKISDARLAESVVALARQ